MDSVDEFARHLAARIAPDEIDLAAYYVRAALDGELDGYMGGEQEHDTVLGGFGAEFFTGDNISIFCQVLGALASVASVANIAVSKRRSTAADQAIDLLAEVLSKQGLSWDSARKMSVETVEALNEKPDLADAFLSGLASAAGRTP